MTGRLISALTVVIFLFASAEIYAVTVSASVDTDEVELGDPINLNITITGEGASLPDPILPDLSDFSVYSSGKNTSFSLKGGRSTSVQELNYTLVPKKTGNLIIGPVIVKDKKTMVSTEPIKVNVKKPGSISGESRTDRRSKTGQGKKERDDFFIEQIVDNKRPYVGQQVTLTFRFYQAVNLWDQPTLEWPKYVGLTVEDLPPNTRSRKYVGGKLYQITEIKRALFPLSSGQIVIESPKLTIKQDNFGMLDPFGMFDRSLRRSRPQVITTNPIRLSVRALPQKAKPVSFTGAVGEYIIRAIADKDSVGVDEPITLKVILSGTGNIKSLPSVEIPEFKDFRVYESGNTESINQQGGTISGSKTFELALIPKTAGIFTVPALEYSFFNPSRGKYKTVRTKPIEILATGEGLTDVGGVPKNIIESARHSLGYIITEFPERKNAVDFFTSVWFWLLQCLPLIGIIAALGFRSHYRKILGDRSYARRISAGRRSKTIFKTAVARKNAGDLEGFFENLYNAILGFVADRLDLEKSGLTVDDLRNMSSIEKDTREKLTDFLDECQSARFSRAGFDRHKADSVLNRASELISALEKVL